MAQAGIQWRSYRVTRFPQYLRILFFVTLGSIAFALPFLLRSFAIFAVVSSAFWLIAILETEQMRPAHGMICFGFLVYSSTLIGTPWLRQFSIQAWLIAPLFYVPLFLPIFILVRLSRRHLSRMPFFLVWPIIFTGVEWLRIRLSPGEMPLLQLGAAVARFTSLIQIVDITGTSGLTFLLSIAGGLFTDIYIHVTRPAFRLKRSMLAVGAICLAVLFVSVLWYGGAQDTTRSFKYGPSVQVVQPNIHGWPDLSHSEARFREAEKVTLQTHNQDVGLVIWPENSFIQRQRDSGISMSPDSIETEIKTLASQLHTPLLVDGPVIQAGMQRQIHRASLVGVDGSVDVYDKTLLVPWSEYVPFQGTLARINPKWADAFLRFVVARNPNFTDTIPSAQPASSFMLRDSQNRTSNFRTPICYEALSSRLLNSWYRALPQSERKMFFLVNPVNEVLLGPSIHEQTFSICRLKAVEGRVCIIRAANNGISGAIDPNGHLYAAFMETGNSPSTKGQGAVYAQVIFDTRFLTVYAKWGDWLPVSCLALYMSLLIYHIAKGASAKFKRSSN